MALPPNSRDQPLTISEVVRSASRTLDAIGLVWLEGEVTQVTKPGSGHLYFSLRDKESVLPAIMWGRDTQRMKFRIEPGQRLRVRGRLGVYERDGRMQLYADFAEPAGLGAEALALEQLKQKLAAEGIFALEKKRALPRFPRRIGVVTSKHGAAVHDIIRTVMRRFPTPILICDAAVQGETAPHQIVNGMAMVVRAGVDVVIVGRGGGSVTDLKAFNHERVVRTIARCPVPVISAVGHEVDLSLADLAADARASTPTAAAELCVPDGHALAEVIRKERRRLDREIHHVLDRARQDLDRCTMALHARGERALAATRHQLASLHHRLAGMHPRARILAHRTALSDLERRLAAVHPRQRLLAHRTSLGDLERRLAAVHPRRRILSLRTALGDLERRLAAVHPRKRILSLRTALGDLERRLAAAQPRPLLARATRDLDALTSRCDAAMREILDERRNELAQIGAQMAAMSPLAVLDRGYAMVRAGDVIVRDAKQVSAKERLHVRLAKGSIDVLVEKVQE